MTVKLLLYSIDANKWIDRLEVDDSEPTEEQAKIASMQGHLVMLYPGNAALAVYFHNGVKLVPEPAIIDRPIPTEAQRLLDGIDPALIHKIVSREQTLKELLHLLIGNVDHYLDANWVDECVPSELIDMAGGQEAFEFSLGEPDENEDIDEDEWLDESDYARYSPETYDGEFED